jgi:hypothetical protein
MPGSSESRAGAQASFPTGGAARDPLDERTHRAYLLRTMGPQSRCSRGTDARADRTGTARLPGMLARSAGGRQIGRYRPISERRNRCGQKAAACGRVCALQNASATPEFADGPVGRGVDWSVTRRKNWARARRTIACKKEPREGVARAKDSGTRKRGGRLPGLPDFNDPAKDRYVDYMPEPGPYLISTRRFCSSRTPSAVGTRGWLSPNASVEITPPGMPRAVR